jgi:hypothetical protein
MSIMFNPYPGQGMRTHYPAASRDDQWTSRPAGGISGLAALRQFLQAGLVALPVRARCVSPARFAGMPRIPFVTPAVRLSR